MPAFALQRRSRPVQVAAEAVFSDRGAWLSATNRPHDGQFSENLEIANRDVRHADSRMNIPVDELRQFE
ncbi:hypothetical protein C5689_03915 [Methylosinus sporium]|uniref:Uncharacterized protein n=1 Tax=Methylosinus sporium TaxID=428 RepID=A0A2U1SUJ7_METSR|nr:hypothetical protein C5689_03915 [Methylosinus sporium]